MDAAALYAGTRTRITELVHALPVEQTTVVVPAAPEWCVRDIVAHLSGAVADILAGNLDGVATEQWTGAQVEARRGRSMAEILDEWATNSPQLEAMVNDFGSAAVQLVMDAVTHEHDIRGAIGQPGARDTPAVDVSLQWLVNSLGGRLEAAGVGAIRLTAGDQEWEVGPGEPGATLAAPGEFELFRALIARRGRDQVAAWKWEGDPSPYLDVLAPWPLRDTDLVE
jgi:uncharacterized protein (TIGR03083 family)